MTQYHNQIQEDFPDASRRKKTNSLDDLGLDDGMDLINFENAVKAAIKAKEKGEESTEVKKNSHLAASYDVNYDSEDFECLGEFPFLSLYEKMGMVSEWATAIWNRETKKFRMMVFVELVDGVIGSVEDFVYDIPKYENELWVVASLCLFLYGGSWVRLASILAATELFGTHEVLHKAYELVLNIMGEDLPSDDHIPFEDLKKTFKDLGMHVALVLAVLYTDFWAEVCVTLAFAIKLTPTTRMYAELFDVSSEDDSDAEWVAILCSVLAAVISSIFYCFFPGVGTAMYMAFYGMRCFLNGQRELWIPTGSFDYVIITTDEFTKSDNQFALWFSAGFTALWQAHCGYSGVFLFLSWSMFLLPAVKIYNFFTKLLQ